MRTTPPNKSPEPTAIGAVSSAVAVHATSRRWLSFFVRHRMRVSSYVLTVVLLLLVTGCRSYSERYVAKRPDLDLKTREAILEHRVILGMFPDEAIAATAGHRQPYVSVVKADPARWPEGSSNDQVIWYERAHPDDSKIQISFWTRTQFDTTNLVGFYVIFDHGRATSITRMPPPPETHLTQEEATRIAIQTAVKHGYRLADYRKPDTFYDYYRKGEWKAVFECKAPTPRCNDFYVYVDDRTENTQIELRKGR